MRWRGGLLACLLAAGVCGCASAPVGKPVPRVMTIEASHPGAAGLDIEQAVARPLETALVAVDGVSAMMARSGEGTCLILLRLADDAKVDAAVEAVRHAVDRAKPKLPEDVSATVFEYGRVRGSDLALVVMPKPNGDPAGDSALLLAAQIERLAGVARCWASGRRQAEVSIELRPKVAADLGVTLADVIAALKTVGARKADLGGLTVKTKAGKVVTIREVAQFKLHAVEAYSYRLNGRRVGLVGVWLYAGTPAEDIERLRQKIRTLKPPPGADRVSFIQRELVPIPPAPGRK